MFPVRALSRCSVATVCVRACLQRQGAPRAPSYPAHALSLTSSTLCEVARRASRSFASQVDDPALLTVFVKRPERTYVEVKVPATASIAALTEAAAIRLGVHHDKATLVLRRVHVDMSTSQPMDTRVAVSMAGIASGDSFELRVQVAGPSLEDLPVLPDSADISRLVTAIRAGSVKQQDDDGNRVTSGGHLVLPTDIKWPDATNNILFVRKFYAPLYQSVLQECKRARAPMGEEFHRRIVTGQPGIGKSVFGWYLIYRILTEQPQRTIVYASDGTKKVTIIPAAGPVHQVPLQTFQFSNLDTMTGLGADPVLIADALVPSAVACPTLVISSPGRIVQRTLKDTLNRYWDDWHYMPIPSEAEVLRMRRVAFSGQSVDDVARRMKLWGPIPRFVLVKTSHQQQVATLSRAMATPLHKLVQVARGQAVDAMGHNDDNDAPHRIVHERAAGQDAVPGTKRADFNNHEYYMRGKIVVASPSFLRYLAERLMEEQAWSAAFLVDASAHLGSLRGIKFEEIVIRMLEKGGKFLVRKLRDDGAAAAEVELKLDACPRITWAKASELCAHRGKSSLMIPRNRNNAGLDAVVWLHGRHVPLDSTVAASHELHVAGLATVVTALGWTPNAGWPRMADKSGSNRDMKILYYWAVPEERFKSGWIRPQKLKTSSLADAAQALDTAAESAQAGPQPPHASATTSAVTLAASDAGTSSLPVVDVGMCKQVAEHISQHVLRIPRAVALYNLADLCVQQGVKLPIELVDAGEANVSLTEGSNLNPTLEDSSQPEVGPCSVEPPSALGAIRGASNADPKKRDRRRARR